MPRVTAFSSSGRCKAVPVGDDVVLTDPWEDLRNADEDHVAQALALESELRVELASGHDLYGRAIAIIGRSCASDDVLVKVGEGWALVHLTWSGRPERSPYPRCTVFHRASDVEQAIDLL